jgi:hypothetical protein
LPVFSFIAETDKLLAGFTDVTKQLREQGKRDNKKREKIEELLLSKARRRLQRRRFLMFWKKGPDESMLYDQAFQQMLIGRKERGHRDDDLLYHPTTKRILRARGYDI